MERKNTGWKVLVCFLLIIILAMGGFILYDKVLKDKYFSKDKTKETDKKDDKKDDTNVVKEKQEGTLNTDNVDYDSKTIILNDEEHTISYTFVESDASEEINAFGKQYIKLDGNEIGKLNGGSSISDIKYTVIEGIDKKDYILLFYNDSLMRIGKIINEKGVVIKEYKAIADDCLIIDDDPFIYAEDEYVYVKKYIEDSTIDPGDGKRSGKVNLFQLTIDENTVVEKDTGMVLDVQVGQCK